MPASHLRARPFVLAILVVIGLFSAGCSSDDAPEVPSTDGTADPVLVEGRTVWSSNCARCHGGAGGGGAGVKLSGGKAVELHPKIDSMIDVVTNGKGAMPAFGKSLSAEKIEAVARYVREVL